MGSRIDLLASYWTLCGKIVPFGGPELEASPVDFRLRVETAARCGYVGVGLMHSDLCKVVTQYGYDGIRAILADNGIRVFELEVVLDWFADGERKKRSDTIKHDLLRAAEKLGARHVKCVGDMDGRPWPRESLIQAFADLCDEAANVGTNMLLEIMPWTNIRTIDTGLDIVSSAAKPNGQLLLDIWHLARGGIPYEDIQKVPAKLIGYVELSDAASKPVGTLLEDTLHRRKLCGEGTFDVRKFVRCIKEAGYAGPFGVEIISEEQRQRSLPDAAEKSYQTAMSQFTT
jgi:sugar phosphate isomerase/epimerase